jgi:MFS family permease
VLRHTAHPTEPRYEILALFTASMIAASLIVVAIGTLLPYCAQAFPQDRSHISLLVTALLLGGLLTTAVSGAATDRFGDKAVLIACGIIMGVSLMVSAAVPSLAWLVLWFVIYGVGFAAMTPVGSHAILFFFKPEERGLAMGIRQMGMPLGGVIGAIVISSTAEYWGYRGALVITGALVLIVTMTAAALYREPPQLYGKPVRAGLLFQDLLRMAKEPRLILITLVCVVLFTGQVALMGFFPWTLVNEAHVSPGLAALVFVITQFAAAAARLLWGWASDRLFHGGRLVPLAITCVLSALSALAVANVAHMPIALLAGVAVAIGFSAEGWFGLAIVAMAEVGGEEHAGSALGFGLTWVYAAGVITPSVFAWIMQTASIPAAWHAIAALCSIGLVPAVGAIMLSRRRVQALESSSLAKS